MEIEALYRYPIKSLGGERVDALTPEERGFVDDRRWMIVDARGRFVSQREARQLTGFRATVTGATGLQIVRLADERVVADLPDARPTEASTLLVTVWDDTFPAQVVPLPSGLDLAGLLGVPGARLVYMSEAVHRAVDPRYARHGEEVSFADGYPYLIASTASLEELSRRLGEPLDVLRFRPNLVVRGAAPFAEDGWSDLRIGAHSFYTPKPCARCVVVTLDPRTGERKPEVLRALSRFRKTDDGKVLFGVNACWRGGVGPVRVGDAVTVVEGVARG